MQFSKKTLKYMFAYVKAENHNSTKKHEFWKVSSTIIKSLKTFFIFASIITSVTPSVTDLDW